MLFKCLVPGCSVHVRIEDFKNASYKSETTIKFSVSLPVDV